MAQNAQAVAPVRPRKTLTIKTTANACSSDAPEKENQQPAQPAQPGEPDAAATGRRGRNVGAQMLQLGEIRPNAGTVYGVIGALVAELGTVTRAGLVDAMGQATFANPKARPADKSWCQGYVAGALRDGILALVPPAPEAGNKAEN